MTTKEKLTTIAENQQNIYEAGYNAGSRQAGTVSYSYTKILDRVEITADDIAAAGDEGITMLTIGRDDLNLANYNEILLGIYIPQSSSINTANNILKIIATSTSQYIWTDYNRFLHVQSDGLTPSGVISVDSNNSYVVSANFYNDNLLYGELRKNGAGSALAYPSSMHAWTLADHNFKLSEKRYFHIAATKDGFKLPAGTYVEVYAR